MESAGRVVVENKLKEKNGVWNVDFDDFEEKAKDCSIFLLCSPHNPHNPLGIVWSREELIKKMEEICRKNDVLLISDEIHSDLIFHGKKHIPTASLSENAKKSVITCVSATKTFNLAGLQAATIIFPDLDKKKIFDSYWFNMEYAVNYIGHNEFSIIKL